MILDRISIWGSTKVVFHNIYLFMVSSKDAQEKHWDFFEKFQRI